MRLIDELPSIIRLPLRGLIVVTCYLAAFAFAGATLYFVYKFGVWLYQFINFWYVLYIVGGLIVLCVLAAIGEHHEMNL